MSVYSPTLLFLYDSTMQHSHPGSYLRFLPLHLPDLISHRVLLMLFIKHPSYLAPPPIHSLSKLTKFSRSFHYFFQQTIFWSLRASFMAGEEFITKSRQALPCALSEVWWSFSAAFKSPPNECVGILLIVTNNVALRCRCYVQFISV